jgi:hypothetical protein
MRLGPCGSRNAFPLNMLSRIYGILYVSFDHSVFWDYLTLRNALLLYGVQMWGSYKALDNIRQGITIMFVTLEDLVQFTCNVNPKEPFFFSTIMVRRRRSSSGLLAVTRSGFTRSRICDCKSNITSIQKGGAETFSTIQWRFQRP